MTASDGILRSRPRYSSAANRGDKTDAAHSGSGSSVSSSTAAEDGTAIRHNIIDGDGGRSAAEVPNLSTKGSRGSKKKNRSLADLVKSSVSLSDEASGITDTDDERGNVISHESSSSGQNQKDVNNFAEGESMATLQISDDGTLFLKDPANNDKSGPEAVDADAAIAVGVVGEDGQQVRFCEYGDEKTDENDVGDKSSSRDRLEQRVDEESDDDFDINEEVRNGNDSDSDSGGSKEDADILRELGLSDLIDMNEEDEMEIDRSDAKSGDLRSFRVLWELLSRWVTPSSIDLVLHYQGRDGQHQVDNSPCNESTQPSEREEEKSNNEPPRNHVDIGASRMAGIMSMLKMNITRSMSELNKMHKLKTREESQVVDQKKVEQRVADLVRTFDSSATAANLNTKMWRGLTTVLIAIAFPNNDSSTDDSVPPSIQRLVMSVEEYRYLTQSAIVSLSHNA